MRTIIHLLVVPVLLLSCNFNQIDGEAEYALKKMHTEVMDIHDEVMPRMTDINQLKKQLKAKLSSPNATNQDSIQQFIYRLEEADEAMMIWMGDFKKPNYSDIKAAEQVYAIEKSKIIIVRDKMNSTISNVQMFLSRQP